MAGARPILIRAIILVVFLLAVLLLAGRQISSLLDLAFTVRPHSLPVSPLSFESTAFRVGEAPLSVLDAGGSKFAVTVRRDDTSRLVISAGGKSITLATITSARGASGFPDGALTPEPGDEVSLTVKRSFMSWPMPFEMNFMPGHSPSWKRHVYYLLRWKKRSGASLEMAWRYEQWYYGSLGWSNGMMTSPGTGVIACKIDDGRAK